MLCFFLIFRIIFCFMFELFRFLFHFINSLFFIIFHYFSFVFFVYHDVCHFMSLDCNLMPSDAVPFFSLTTGFYSHHIHTAGQIRSRIHIDQICCNTQIRSQTIKICGALQQITPPTLFHPVICVPQQIICTRFTSSIRVVFSPQHIICIAFSVHCRSRSISCISTFFGLDICPSRMYDLWT